MDACAPAAATTARGHAVAAARVAGVAEASVRAVRLCAESGGLVVIPFVFYSSSPISLLASVFPVQADKITGLESANLLQACNRALRVANTISAPVASPLVPPDQDASKSYAKVPAATRV